MIVDERSIKDIKNDIEKRMICLGKVVIMRKVSIILFIISFILSISNIIKWIMSGLEMNSRCIMIVLWMLFSVIILLFQNALQSFSMSLKQSIYNDNKILSKL